jgi:hypothetical protein
MCWASYGYDFFPINHDYSYITALKNEKNKKGDKAWQKKFVADYMAKDCKSVARDRLLRHAEGADGTPLIVIARQHQLTDAAEYVIFRNQLGGKVAMVVDNGQILCHIVVKMLCRFVLQQKVFTNNAFHFYLPFEGGHSVTPDLKMAISR